MADIILSRLEEKFQLVLKKMQLLQEENKRLEQTLAEKTIDLDVQQRKLEELKHQLTTQKIAANTLSEGVEASGHIRGELKRTLNKYIKEIDHCIAQLNE